MAGRRRIEVIPRRQGVRCRGALRPGRSRAEAKAELAVRPTVTGPSGIHEPQEIDAITLVSNLADIQPVFQIRCVVTIRRLHCRWRDDLITAIRRAVRQGQPSEELWLWARAN